MKNKKNINIKIKNKIKQIFILALLVFVLVFLTIIEIKDYEKNKGASKNNSNREGLLIKFPEDEYPHKNTSKEWWYFNSHLKDEEGHNYGIMNLIHQNGYSIAIIIDKDNKKYYFFNNQSNFKPISTKFIDWKILGNFTYLVDSSFNDISTSVRLKSNKKPLLLNLGSPIEDFFRKTYYLTNVDAEGKITIHNDTLNLKGKALVGHAWDIRKLKPFKFEWISIQLG